VRRVRRTPVPDRCSGRGADRRAAGCREKSRPRGCRQVHRVQAPAAVPQIARAEAVACGGLGRAPAAAIFAWKRNDSSRSQEGDPQTAP
jgi:hypothetical protein